MKFLIIVLALVMLQSCVPSFKTAKNDRLYIKEIDEAPVKLEWFFYSTISTVTPDYILINTKDRTDTVCVANNIADLNLKDNKIVIGFYGKPKNNGIPFMIPSTVLGYEVISDTNYVLKAPTPRKFYKRD